MYKYSVPICVNTITEESLPKYKKQLKEGGFKRVFLVGDGYPYRKKDFGVYTNYEAYVSAIKTFKDMGLEVGVWVNGIGHGSSFAVDNAADGCSDYQLIVGVDGRSSSVDAYCPLNESFVKNYMSSIEKVASLHPDMIMLDDDFRLNLRRYYRMGCACPQHMREYKKLVGEEVPREKLECLVFSGGNNKYRKAWFEMARNTLHGFAQKVRAAVDKYDKSIRLGFCSCYDTWDFSGTDGMDLTRVFTGDNGNLPFMRTISPPYQYQRVAMGVEQTRMQAAWCKGSGIELFAEGDSYPRVRHDVPARVVEMYDLALLATGEIDGILKYVYDYYHTPDFESAYISSHIRNAKLRADFCDIFSGKHAVGVKISEAMHKNEAWELPEKTEPGVSLKIQNSFYGRAQRLMTANSIPTAYDEGRVAVVFGENARYISEEELKCGAVVDSVAAKILKSRGIDTGIIDSHIADFSRELFNGTIGSFGTGPVLHNMTCSDKAVILSRLYPADAVGSYLYENENGQRFYVFAYDAYESSGGDDNAYSTYFSNYARQKQLTEAVEWIGREPLPAKCNGNPFLYLITSKNDSGSAMSVAMFNVFADAVEEPVITLDRNYNSVKFVNCEGKLCQNEIKLSRIEPYGIAAFEVKL